MYALSGQLTKLSQVHALKKLMRRLGRGGGTKAISSNGLSIEVAGMTYGEP